MPGPLLTVNISESSRRGFIVGPLLMLGHSILELSLLIALLFGLAPFFNQNGFKITISLIGGSILLWMAMGMFRALPSLSLNWDVQQVKGNNLVLTGILMSLANPYWILWWATVGIDNVTKSREYGILGIFFFFIGHILADFVWYTMISTAVGQGRTFLNDRLYKGLIGVCAAALVVFACLFIGKALYSIVI
jgi:threonine/homoserine/homoserine lactone efflux protein